MAVPSTQPKNPAGSSVRFSDGTTPTPVTKVADLYRGDYTLSPLPEYLNEDVYFDVRTANAGIGIGAPVRPTLSFSLLVGNYIGNTDTAPGTALEFVTGKGAYDANVSTRGAGKPMTVDVRLSIEGTAFGDSSDETIDCEDVRFSSDVAQAMDGNTLTMNGIVTGNIIFTNATNIVTFSPFPI